MKTWKKAILLFLLIMILFSGYLIHLSQTATTSESRGSFTTDRTYSYDKKYYALQEVKDKSDTRMIEVSIYETETDSPVFSFYPARASDFWGICWENKTYNIWIQSGDIGVFCYKYENMQWLKDRSARRPAYIISKYDK